MNWADLLDWAVRIILGGLAALVGLGLFVILLETLGKVFGWLGRTLWSLGRRVVRLVHSPQPWAEAPRPSAISAQKLPQHPLPAPLAELVRLWENGFDIRPLWDLPGSETFFMSYYVYPQLWEPDAPSILVETTKPRNDQDRWRLAMPSGKDVLCIEIDQGTFLAWWRQTLFSIKGEMSLTGWVGVYELIRDYCVQCPHDYPRWQYTKDLASASWRQGIIERLAAYHDAVLYATSWGNTVAHVAFWVEELVALHRPLPRPNRNWATNELRTQTNWAANLDHRLKHTQSIRLIDLLRTDDGVSALLGRLHEKSMLFGYEEVLDCSPECVWTLHGDRPVCLPLKPVLPEGDGNNSQRVQLPKVWVGDGHQLPDKEPIFLHESALIVSNADGMRGLVARDGRFVLPCRYAYLVNVPGEEGYFEVAETLAQDRRGELLCDLIDHASQRINPTGMKVLAGTCQQTGCVVTTEDESRPLRLDWMDIAGVVRNSETMLLPDGLRWAAVGKLSEGLRQVRCPDSGLWGYLDESGAVAISPRFRVASAFENGLASAGEEGRLGMIRQDGTWRIAPDWSFITQKNDGSFFVRNSLGELNFLDSAGRRLPVPPWPTEIVEEIKANLLAELNREHDGPFQGIGTMSDLARVMMGLVEPYEYDNPAVAYHTEEIYALLYELAGVKRR